MVERQTNWIGQLRIDVPLLRAMESSVAADFDVAAGWIVSGKQPLVVTGFKLVNIATGGAATQVQVAVAGSVLMNFNASESGTAFQVPSNRANEVLNSTNANVSGSWTANATNFIGVDLLRSADATTSDTLQFLNATTLAEVPKNIPLGRTLNYRFVISTTSFSAQPNLVPIAKVVTDSNTNIVSVQDCRNIFGRVAPGGDFAAINQGYSWPGGRAENLTGDVFSGGDKVVASIREWAQAVMTRIWESGGGEYWYSATADRNVTMAWTGTTFTDGENFEWVGLAATVAAAGVPGAQESGNTVTITTTGAHGFSIGQIVVLANITVSGYNGTFQILSTGFSATTFQVTNPNTGLGNSGTGTATAFGNLHWKGLRFIFDNSTGYVNDVQDQTGNNPGQTDLADGQCLYVDLDRTQNRAKAWVAATSYTTGQWASNDTSPVKIYECITPGTSAGGGGPTGTGSQIIDNGVVWNYVSSGAAAPVPVKANLSTLGPGSVPGARQLLAWRIGNSINTRQWRYTVGTTFVPATTTSLGVVKLAAVSSQPATPLVITDGGGTITGTTLAAPLQINGFPVLAGVGGDALYVTGGNAASGNSTGGLGISATGGQAFGSGVGGFGGVFTGGSGGTAGTGGVAIAATAGPTPTATATGSTAITGQGGAGHGTNQAGGSGVVGTGGAPTGSGVGGTGIVGNGGSQGYGVLGNGNAAGHGVVGLGSGATIPVGIASSYPGSGVVGRGLGSSPGVLGLGNGSSGVYGLGQSSTDIGVTGLGGTTGAGGFFQNGGSAGSQAVQIPNNQYYGYSTTVSKTIHLLASDFNPFVQSAFTSGSTGGLANRYAYLQSNGASSPVLFATVRIPAGSTITGVTILASNASGTNVLNMFLTALSYNAGGDYSSTAIDSANPNVFSLTGAVALGWQSATTGTWNATAIPTGIVGTSEGVVQIEITMPIATAANFQLHGVRIAYNLPNQTPAL